MRDPIESLNIMIDTAKSSQGKMSLGNNGGGENLALQKITGILNRDYTVGLTHWRRNGLD